MQVLCSSGLDSAVLLAEYVARRAAIAKAMGLVRQNSKVVPIYVSVGLAWEPGELAMLDRLSVQAPFRDVQPVQALRFDMRDIPSQPLGDSRGAARVFDTPDEDVFLEGRNAFF